MQEDGRFISVNNQQWFAKDAIIAIDDLGYNVTVTIKGGRNYLLCGDDRERFFKLMGLNPS